MPASALDSAPGSTARRTHRGRGRPRPRLCRQAQRHVDQGAAARTDGTARLRPARDTIVVIGVDRLGRTAAEVMLTIKELLDKEIVIKTLREGVDSSTATGRMVMGIMASLAELEWSSAVSAAPLPRHRAKPATCPSAAPVVDRRQDRPGRADAGGWRAGAGDRRASRGQQADPVPVARRTGQRLAATQLQFG